MNNAVLLCSNSNESIHYPEEMVPEIMLDVGHNRVFEPGNDQEQLSTTCLTRYPVV